MTKTPGTRPASSRRPQITAAPTKGSLVDLAHARIKQAIIECELAPGAAISRPALEVQTGLTSAAVRTALARLEQEGLVRAVPRRGYVVAPFTIEDISEIFLLRRLVEPLVTRLAAGCLSPDDLKTLGRLGLASFEPGRRHTYRAYVAANRDFHMLIARASRNRRLTQLLGQVHDDSMRMTYLTMAFQDFREDWGQNHRRILEALAAGDGFAAERASIAEIDAGHDAVVRVLLSNRALAGVNLVPAMAAPAD
jgi:DNA-binding GntR family transcriptional regulator